MTTPPPPPPSGPPAPSPEPPPGLVYPLAPPGYVYPAPPAGYAYPPAPAQYAYGMPPGYPVILAPPPVAPNGQRLAEFGDRFLAYLIDLALLTVAAFIVQIPFIIWFFTAFFDGFFIPVRTVNQEPYPPPVFPDATLFLTFFALTFALALVILGLQYIYEVEMMFRSGQTLGKRVMKLRVIPLAPDATLTRKMAFKRFLVQDGAAAIVPGLTYLDGLWQLWDKPYRQCLHDKFATTVVIKLDS